MHKDEFEEIERVNSMSYMHKDERERNISWMFMKFDRDLN